MSCEFARYDGAYVLGALSQTERSEYQSHLRGCPECTRAVQELAGLPGLLARVSADELGSAAVDELVPDTLLPALVRQARSTQRRRLWMTAGTAAAGAVIVAAGSLAIRGALDDDLTAVPSSPGVTDTLQAGRAMVPVGSQSMSANLALTRVPWGTRLDLTCTYESAWTAHQEPDDSTYALFVRTRDGRVQQVATWRALPGKTMRLTSATATSLDAIASAEIRTADGKPVLKLGM